MDKAVYSTTVATLGFVCFTVAAIAVGLPLWGYFDNPEGESPRTRTKKEQTILRVRPAARRSRRRVPLSPLTLREPIFFLAPKGCIIAFVRAGT